MRGVLTLAMRAPSMRNAQPWRWQLASDGLTLFADPSRHPRYPDPERRDLMISGGATLHHCTVALAAMGWHSRIERLPDPADPDHLATITLSAQPPDDLDVMLAGAIGRGPTDPRTYSRLPVPWDNIAVMGARAARAGVILRQVEPSPQLAAVFAGPDAGRAQTGPVVDDNGVVVALGTHLDDDLARLRAGEATSVVLLSATAMGLASCPVTEPLEIPETREALRAEVFDSNGFPQMLMRFGRAVDAEPVPATLARSLLDVADRPTGPTSLEDCG